MTYWLRSASPPDWGSRGADRTPLATPLTASDIMEDLTCAVCRELFNDPKVLRCGHSFCLDCVLLWLQSQPNTGSLPCPECRAETEVTNLESLPTNIVVKRAVASLQNAASKASQI